MPVPREVPISGRKLSSFTIAELEGVLPKSSSAGLCQRYYNCKGEKLTELMTMCIGLKGVDDRYLWV
jgi:hypothetical protein